MIFLYVIAFGLQLKQVAITNIRCYLVWVIALKENVLFSTG